MGTFFVNSNGNHFHIFLNRLKAAFSSNLIHFAFNNDKLINSGISIFHTQKEKNPKNSRSEKPRKTAALVDRQWGKTATNWNCFEFLIGVAYCFSALFHVFFLAAIIFIICHDKIYYFYHRLVNVLHHHSDLFAHVVIVEKTVEKSISIDLKTVWVRNLAEGCCLNQNYYIHFGLIWWQSYRTQSVQFPIAIRTQ